MTDIKTSREVRQRCYDAVCFAWGTRGSFQKSPCLLSVAADLAARVQALNDDDRARVIMANGRGDTVEQYWAAGAEIADFLLDGTLPTSLPQPLG